MALHPQLGMSKYLVAPTADGQRHTAPSALSSGQDVSDRYGTPDELDYSSEEDYNEGSDDYE